MCDPQLFQEHVWFWEPGLKVRTLAMMIPIYHDIVGRGMVMELAFSIDRDGLVQDTHAAVYRALGEWVRACYGTPLASTSGSGVEFALRVTKGAAFDRLQLMENIVVGQRVRNYTIETRPSAGAANWTVVAGGGAIGRKRIVLLPGPVTAAEDMDVRVRVIRSVAPPELLLFGVYRPCAQG